MQYLTNDGRLLYAPPPSAKEAKAIARSGLGLGFVLDHVLGHVGRVGDCEIVVDNLATKCCIVSVFGAYFFVGGCCTVSTSPTIPREPPRSRVSL